MGTTVVVIGTLGLVGAFILMVKKSFREHVGTWFAEKPIRLWSLPVTLLGYYTLCALAADQLNLNLLAELAAYFGLPTLLLYLTGPKSDDIIAVRDLVINLSVLLWLWLLIELGLVQADWLSITTGNVTRGVGAFAIYSATIYSLVVLSGWRKFDFHCDLSFKKSYLVPVVATFEILAVILLFITLPTGLTRAGIAKMVKSNVLGLPLAIALPSAILVGFPVLFFGLGLWEELLFRGGIQNLLGHHVKPIMALFIAAAVFGLSHLNNKSFGLDFPNWPYAGLATIAGVGYGCVFWRTRSVVASATVHALIDLMWPLFFKGQCR